MDAKQIALIKRRAPHLLSWTGQGPFPGWLKNPPASSFTFTPVDPEMVAFAHKRLRDGKNVPAFYQALAATADQIDNVVNPKSEGNAMDRVVEALKALGVDTKAMEQRFAASSNYQPPTRTGLGVGLGYAQAEYMGTFIMPEYVGGLDLKADYPVFGTEMFEVVGNTKKQFGAKSDRIDINIKFNTVTVAQHHKEATVEQAERAGGVFLPNGIDTIKAEVLRTQLRTEKEIDIAAIVAATGSYTGGFSTTLAGSTQWSHASGVPINDLVSSKAKVRKAARQRADLFWQAPDVTMSLQKNAQIIDAVKYTGTRLSPGGIVPPEGLVALFMMTILTGEAGAITSAGGSLGDIWGQDAGIVVTGRGQTIAQRFGLTVTTLGYPSAMEYEDNSVGSKGATVLKESDAYIPEKCNGSAGYLFKAASAVL